MNYVPRIKRLRLRTSAQCKKKRLFYESLKINRKKGKEILLFFCLLFVLLFFLWDSSLSLRMTIIHLSLKSQSHWWHGARPAEDYALNVLKLDSTFFEITFLTASISVEIAFSSVSNCFNFNSKFLSWAWMISIFELISWISLSYWFLL